MKIGDVVSYRQRSTTEALPPQRGLVVGFNKKGEGGQDFVHVLIDGDVVVYMQFDLVVHVDTQRIGAAINKSI